MMSDCWVMLEEDMELICWGLDAGQAENWMARWEARLGVVFESSEGDYRQIYPRAFLSGIESTECKARKLS